MTLLCEHLCLPFPNFLLLFFYFKQISLSGLPSFLVFYSHDRYTDQESGLDLLIKQRGQSLRLEQLLRFIYALQTIMHPTA